MGAVPGHHVQQPDRPAVPAQRHRAPHPRRDRPHPGGGDDPDRDVQPRAEDERRQG
ncbi:hypothetical protein G5V59_26015 [Nocardioides sp. W3-2-3]|uniref:hypothetical protein n=1 Tax=Nocardioides convexus TaxID=2712224 RepID=UPI0024186277|nr:hypothetical protein [Nocardioides convexus]NHA01918.1 hypothetical protein [Nocardioides convexus]